MATKAKRKKRRVASETSLDHLRDHVMNETAIERDLYEKFNVKRGLRNPDGTGVLVGLTRIGMVRGYVIDENEKKPVKGRLYYRGYSVEELARGFMSEGRPGFEESCYLLLFGELPDVEHLTDFRELLGNLRDLPTTFTEDMILKKPSRSVMNKLARAVLACYSFDDQADDIDVPNVFRQCIALIARFPVMVAYGYQALAHYYEGHSLFLHNPRPELSTAENFLRMIRPDKQFSELEAQILDLALVLHAEHGGGNNSAFTTHVVTSTDTDTYSAVAAAVGSLKGPKHGGASLRVGEMMDDLKATIGESPDDGALRDYLSRIMDREAFDRSGLIYGLGHAVYTISDPRTRVLKNKARELAEEKGMQGDLALYEAVERLGPEVFNEKKGTNVPLCANVDMYSGLVYSMLGIPQSLHTTIFAIARIAGWSAHRIEEIVSGQKVIRPAYKSVMPREIYVPLANR